MKPACRNSPASRSIATAPLSSASRASTTLLTCGADRAARQAARQCRPGRSRHWQVIPGSQQNQAIEAAFDQHHPFGEACWCVKAEPPCRVGLDPAPGSTLADQSKALWAFSSIPGSHLSSVRPINPCPSGEPSGKMMRPIQRFKSDAALSILGLVPRLHARGSQHRLPGQWREEERVRSGTSRTRREEARAVRIMGATATRAATSSCCQCGRGVVIRTRRNRYGRTEGTGRCCCACSITKPTAVNTTLPIPVSLTTGDDRGIWLYQHGRMATVAEAPASAEVNREER